MSSESKTHDGSKPVAMAIPKGGYFKDKAEQGRYGSYLSPRHPPVTGSRSSRKSFPVAKRKFYCEHARTIWKRRSPSSRIALCAKIGHYLRWLMFPYQWGKPTSCTRAFSIPTSTNTPKTLSRCSRPRAFLTVFENLEGISLWTR